MSGCSLLEDDSILDGAYTDYDTYLNAELTPFPPFSARSLHFHGTRYVLSFEVDCRAHPVETVGTLELLAVPPGVDVEAWIRYRNADFGNEYMDIKPQRHAFVAGATRLTDVRVEEETRRYGGEEVSVQRVYYRFESEDLAFEGGLKVPSIQTEVHYCFVGNGLGGSQ